MFVPLYSYTSGLSIIKDGCGQKPQKHYNLLEKTVDLRGKGNKIHTEYTLLSYKIFFLPIRILQNFQIQNHSYRKFRRAQKFRTFHTGKNIRLAVSLTGSCDFTSEISGFRQLMSSPVSWFEHSSSMHL